MGAVVVTRITTRATWAAVTSGTPSWSTLAVTHISAMPPGAVASTIVEIGIVPTSARPHAKRAETRTARNTEAHTDRKSTRLNSSHTVISYAVFCLKKKT